MFSSNSSEANPFSWVYDSGKEYLNNVNTINDVNFWKGACCVMVGLFAFDKCVPLAKSTLRFIFRVPKKETELEKVNKDIVALKAQVDGIQQAPAISEESIQELFKKWTQDNVAKRGITDKADEVDKEYNLLTIQKKIDECSVGIVKLCNVFQINKDKVNGIEQRINKIMRHINQDTKVSTSSSSSEEDDSEKLEKRRQRIGGVIVGIPRMNFKDLHKRINPHSSNCDFLDTIDRSGPVSNTEESDASGESSSSSTTNSDVESASKSFSRFSSTISTPKTPNSLWKSNSMIINSGDYDEEFVLDEKGKLDYIVRSPRTINTPRSKNSSQKVMKRKRIGSSSDPNWKPRFMPSLLKRSNSLPCTTQQDLDEDSKIIQINAINEEIDEDSSHFFFTEDDQSIALPDQLTPTTPNSHVISQFTDLGNYKDESPVKINEDEKEEIAYARYYADYETEEEKERKKTAKLRATTEEKCFIT